MKNVLRVLIVAAFVAAFALPAFAQDAAAQAPAAGPCTAEAEAKAALYAKFRENRTGTPEQQKTAYESAKEYLAKYGSCSEATDQQITKYLQGWVPKYEKAVRDFACTDAYNKKDYAKTFEVCNAVLAVEPENLDTVLLLVKAGYANVISATPNKALNAQAIRATRRAAELIGADKAPTKWDAPFPSKDEALGFLYYAQGVFAQDTSPADAAASFIKAAQSNSTFKREASTYTYLATIYESTELKKLIDEYNAAFPSGKEITEEQKPKYQELLGQIGRVQDRIIDALARAAAILKADPKADAKTRDAVMNKLTRYYKARHEDKDEGLPQLIANVMNTPLMLPGQEPAPAATSSSAVSGTDGAVKPSAAQPAANGAKPAPSTTTNGSGAKPASNPPKPQVKTTTKAAAKTTTSGR